MNDLVEFGDSERITIADIKASESRRLVKDIQNEKVDFMGIDIRDHHRVVAQIRP